MNSGATWNDLSTLSYEDLLALVKGENARFKASNTEIVLDMETKQLIERSCIALERIANVPQPKPTWTRERLGCLFDQLIIVATTLAISHHDEIINWMRGLIAIFKNLQ